MLSAVLVDPLALDKVHPPLKPEHFYSEAHRQIFQAAIDLRAKGEPVDVVTVGIELRARERIAQVGGMGYLTDVLNAAPAVANVTSYAKRITETWRVRQLGAACQRIAATCYVDFGETKAFLEASERAIYEVARDVESSELVAVGPTIKETLSDLAHAAKRGDLITGLPTGFDRYDRLTAGLHDGDLTIVAGRPGMGKAQPLDEPVLTPKGWTRMEDLAVGDHVIGADGRPARVLAVHERGRLPVFRVTFDDALSARCCADHLWVTRSRSERRRGLPASAKSTSDIRASAERRGGGRNHSCAFVGAVEFAQGCPLPIDPYVLGVYLGDGSSNGNVCICKPEKDVLRRVEERLPPNDTVSPCRIGFRIRRRTRSSAASDTLTALKALGLGGLLSHEKFVPKAYLYASREERLEVLRGLFDTDGHVTVSGRSVEYATSSPMLRDAVAHLARSLGAYVTSRQHPCHYVKNGQRFKARDSYRMIIAFQRGETVPVASKKHLAKLKQGGARIQERFIESVTPDGEAHCRCITVDRGEYVTRDFLVTHNSALVFNIATIVASKRIVHGTNTQVDLDPAGVCIFSLEMPRDQCIKRMLCAEAQVDLSRIRSPGFLSPLDWQKLTEAARELHGAPIWIDDTPGLSALDLRAKVRRKQAEFDERPDDVKPGHRRRRVGLVIVDYVQLMTGDGDNREQEVAGLSRSLKAIAKELRVPVVALAQLNRQTETRSEKSKRPQLSDLRESGALEQDADNILFVYRDEYYNKDSAERGIAELILAKQRNGPTGTAKVRFDREYTRFENIAEGEYVDDEPGDA